MTKFTLIIFYPLCIIVFFIYHSNKYLCVRSRSLFRKLFFLFLIFILSFLIINVGYNFEGTGAKIGAYKFRSKLLTGMSEFRDIPRIGANRFDGTIFSTFPIPLPSNFIQGIDTQRYEFERGLSSYLRGQWSEHGWWYYYLYALLIKMPLGTIFLFLLAVFCTFFLKGYNTSWQGEMIILLPGIVLLAFVSSQTGFSIHSRYAIPALPFFLIWMSKVGLAFSGIPHFLTQKNLKQMESNFNRESYLLHEKKESTPNSYPQGYKIVRVLTVVFLVWSVLSSLSAYPHSLSYFNELAVIIPTPKRDDYPQISPIKKPDSLSSWYKIIISAGPRNGPRHLLDSNIDWGQDLFYLERWCKNHPEVDSIKVAYSGTYPIELTTIPSKESPLAIPEPGWYAISVNNIYSRDGQYRYFLNYTPVDMAGYSIYIYHLTPLDIVTQIRK